MADEQPRCPDCGGRIEDHNAVNRVPEGLIAHSAQMAGRERGYYHRAERRLLLFNTRPQLPVEVHGECNQGEPPEVQ